MVFCNVTRKPFQTKFPIETVETRLEKEKYLPKLLKYIRSCMDKTYFPMGGRLKMLMNRWRPLGASVLVVERNHASLQEQNSSDEETSPEEILFRIPGNSPTSKNIRRSNVGLDKEWGVERNTVRVFNIYKSRSSSTESERENEISYRYASSELLYARYIFQNGEY
jgi:hypothetical protein